MSSNKSASVPPGGNPGEVLVKASADNFDIRWQALSSGGDDSGSGDKNLDIYSTEETQVGIWIDGKPIYRKYISMALPTGTQTNIDFLIHNKVDVLISQSLYTEESNGAKYYLPKSGNIQVSGSITPYSTLLWIYQNNLMMRFIRDASKVPNFSYENLYGGTLKGYIEYTKV